MKQSIVFIATLLICLLATVNATEKPLFNATFSPKWMDTSIHPGDDFFRYANGAWLKATEIPEDKSSWGSFNEVVENNVIRIKSILESTAKEQHKTGSIEQKVADFYTSAMDEATIEKLGVEPIKPMLNKINAISNKDQLPNIVAEFNKQAIFPFIGLYVYADRKQSDMNILYITQGGLGLPDRDYYFDEKHKKVVTEYAKHISNMFELVGETPKHAKNKANAVLKFETTLAENSDTKVETRDLIKTYNKVNIKELSEFAPSYQFATLFKQLNIDPKHAIAMQPHFLKALDKTINATSLDDLKTYLAWNYISDTAPYLNQSIVNENFRFYGTVVNGTPTIEPRYKRATRYTSNALGFALGQIYVKKYFPPEAKEKMLAMVENIKSVFKSRVENLDWMSKETKKEALKKLAKFTTKIAYPDEWRNYDALTIKPGNFFENVMAANFFEYQREAKKVNKPVDRKEWFMTPQTVNAYYNPPNNEIVFPAGILQPPFFDPNADDAINYGAIGAVIGHEITHGYDDRGRKYDSTGNLRDWWTEEDAKKFTERSKKLIEQFNQYEALPDIFINGELTISENIADFGGIIIAYEAYQKSLEGKPKPEAIDGLTDSQRFFLSFGQAWRIKWRNEALKRKITTGPHSPGQFRAIGPLVNFDPFYQTFDLQKGQKLYKDPTDRVDIW